MSTAENFSFDLAQTLSEPTEADENEYVPVVPVRLSRSGRAVECAVNPPAGTGAFGWIAVSIMRRAKGELDVVLAPTWALRSKGMMSAADPVVARERDATAEAEARIAALGSTPPRMHNGVWTIASPGGESWRTVRIRTQPATARFKPGFRLASVLAGPDNSEGGNWTAVGLCDDSGFSVFKRHRGGDWERLMRALWALAVEPREGDPEWHAATRTKLVALGWTVLVEGRCVVCNRRLTTPESITSGIGPVCGGR